MASAELVSSLIALIYDAAMDRGRWPAFLDGLAKAIGGTATQFLYHDVRHNRGRIATSIRLDPNAKQLYDEYYVTIDPWLLSAKARGLLTPGSVHIGEGLVPRNKLVRSEYYSDLARPFDLTRNLAAVIRYDEGTLCSVTSFRSERSKSFGEDERGLLLLLMPHLQRAIQIHQRFSTVDAANGAAMDVLNRLSIAAFITEGDGTVVYANTAARTMVAARDGLSSDRRVLAAARPDEQRALRGLIRAAARTSAGGSGGSGGVMTISRPSLRRSLLLLVTPIAASSLSVMASGAAAAAVFVTDPDHISEPDTARLRRIWGLTATESAIAVKLAAGLTLREVAESLEISINTARWHLKHVFAKTQTHSQNGLVRVICTNLAVTSSPTR